MLLATFPYRSENGLVQAIPSESFNVFFLYRMLAFVFRDVTVLFHVLLIYTCVYAYIFTYILPFGYHGIRAIEQLARCRWMNPVECSLIWMIPNMGLTRILRLSNPAHCGTRTAHKMLDMPSKHRCSTKQKSFAYVFGVFIKGPWLVSLAAALLCFMHHIDASQNCLCILVNICVFWISLTWVTFQVIFTCMFYVYLYISFFFIWVLWSLRFLLTEGGFDESFRREKLVPCGWIVNV